ncbi:polysaccharide biosynthesis tyrosine autokinase [Streptomyces sp. NPDC004059]
MQGSFLVRHGVPPPLEASKSLSSALHAGRRIFYLRWFYRHYEGCSLDLRIFLKTLARRWPTVVACLVLSIGAALAVTRLATPVYKARTQLFVATRIADDTAQMNEGQSFSQARVQSYAEIVTTRQVTAFVVQKLRLHTTPEELASRITAVAPLNTVLIDITVQDTAPRRAARIANAVAERFRAVVERLETPNVTVDSRQSRKSRTGDAAPVSPVSLGITQEAVAPAGPVSPRPMLNLAAGVLGGLLLGAGLVSLREALDTTVKTSERLGELTSLPVLGSIPFDKGATQNRVAMDAASTSVRAEAFRKLRTNLQFAQVDNRPQVIVVTSPVPGEGKTTTAVNLALALVDAGMRTCLVDADLRRPSVAGTFGLVEDAGLTSVLIGQARAEEVVQQAGGRLAVITSGPLPPNPTELLSCGRMAELLRDLADEYDMVVVDSAPVLPVADTMGLAPLADGVLCVVRASKTGRDQIRSATESLNRIGVRTLGTVFSMAPLVKGKGYGYGYGYGYAAAEVPVPRPPTRGEEPAQTGSLSPTGEK